jgi:two-component system LytT family response regulator
MIRAIVIDDEAHLRKDVIDKLKENFSTEIVVVEEADSVADGIAAIEKFEPDMLFLDIQINGGTSFDILDQVVYKKFEIIFITGFDQHAIKAIKVGAMDYILKPIDEDEFVAAVRQAIEKKERGKDIEKLAQISSEYFKGSKDKRIILKTTDNVYAIYEQDILYCRSEGNYTTFFTQQMEKIVVSKSIKKVEEILTDDVFIRCHQSYIVNKNHVIKYNKKGVLNIILDVQVPVSSRRKDYALQKIFD